MSPFYTTTIASSLLSLALFTGVAEAGRNASSPGPSQISRAPQAPSNISRSTKPFIAAINKTELRRPEFKPVFSPVFRPVLKQETKPKPSSTSRPTPEIKIAQPPKLDPRVTTKIEHLKSRTAGSEVNNGKSGLTPFKRIEQANAAVSSAGAKVLAAQLTSMQQRRLAPMADVHKHVSDKSMNHFVATQVLRRQAAVVSKADGPVKYQAAVNRATTLIKDPAKGYQIAKYGEGKKPGEAPKGDTGTIVINENNKTVYVPASSVSGPDRRTIIVNCNNCKVVIVGATGKDVVDERKIVVNGHDDKIVLQSNKSSGAAGQNGGTVTDNRQVVVNGDDNKIKLQGDQANGGDGQRGKMNGQAGGAGGYVDDNRKVTVNGDDVKVTLGQDSANGGAGGKGSQRGGDGGNGGKVDDDRIVVVNGDDARVNSGGADANGGRGGNGGASGGNGGAGGDLSVKGGVIDNGHGNRTNPGDYNANGGDGGSGKRQ